MAKPIYVRYKGRYWRLSVLFREHGISPSAGYHRHKANNCPKIYKKWMLSPPNSAIAAAIQVTIDGVTYASMKEAVAALGVSKNKLGRRVKKLGTTLTLEQITSNSPKWNGVTNLKKKKKIEVRPASPNHRPLSEWEMLSSKGNTGAARREEGGV